MDRGIYRKKRVFSLSDNALRSFCNTLIQTLGTIENKGNKRGVILELKEYIESLIGVTSKIHDDLLRVIFRSDILPSVRLNGLRTLLNRGVKKFENGVPHYISDTELWDVFSKQSKEFRLLHFDNVVLPERLFDLFNKILRKSPNLTSLQLPYNCCDRTLNSVAEYSKNLRFLKIPDFYNAAGGIGGLRNSFLAETLFLIDLNAMGNYPFEEVCWNMAKVLQCCPNLQSISQFVFTSKALRICKNYDKNFKCNLRYVCDSDTTIDCMQVIVKTCPKMEALDLIIPYSGSLKALEGTSLQKLGMNIFVCSELINLLEKIGHKLRYLDVNEGNVGISIEDIARYCQSLTELKLNNLDSLTMGSFVKNFIYLEKITIIQIDFPALDFKRLVCSLTNLRFLLIEKLIINDECLESIFRTHHFKRLEEFYIFEAPELTIASVQMLLSTCPSLQKIGKLSGWKLIQNDIDSIGCLERCEKYDFILKSPIKLSV